MPHPHPSNPNCPSNGWVNLRPNRFPNRGEQVLQAFAPVASLPFKRACPHPPLAPPQKAPGSCSRVQTKEQRHAKQLIMPPSELVSEASAARPSTLTRYPSVIRNVCPHKNTLRQVSCALALLASPLRQSSPPVSQPQLDNSYPHPHAWILSRCHPHSGPHTDEWPRGRGRGLNVISR